ncbi:hypothetical protein AWL63_16975 [Sphingomonas panacis]|uniref:Preprotein translocase subunit YajC n=1 Tax=Sphingomonas panacis TaxID=1560345 RepID=A0A1B3ZD82_9SPHN|nr:hypothetical protein [Sphingomonas panacis]AOH85384.1 hypothetical protein AWL63_16975 [Sphingomonas panacis]
MKRMLLTGAACATLLAAPVHAQDRHKSISPYIELSQVAVADLSGDNDVLTYSTVAAGVDADLHTNRADLQVSYRYERRIAWSKRVGDSDVHSGLARAAVKIAPGVSLDGGALATRSRYDIRGAAPVNLAGNVDNISQVYSAYAGPTLATNAGPVAINAAYRYGYTKVESPGSTGVAPGAQRLDVFDSAQSHVATASAGVKAGEVLPVGVTVSGAYERDTATQLSQRYEGKYGRGDVVLPVTRTLALRGGVGYEKIKITQKDALLDAGGNPVIDRNGRYVTNQASPRRIAYETDGLIYDAGVIWRPSPRTLLTANVGKRYGGVSYTGSFSYSPSRAVSFQLGVYDSVTTFGRQLQDGISRLPTSFIDQRDAFGQQFGGCTFGNTAGSAGGCLNGVFQSISSSSYRARGVDAILSANRGPFSYGIGAGYANRKFFAPEGEQFTVDGVEDESVYAQAFASVTLDRVSSISADVIANYYKSGIAGSRGIYSEGATATYYRSFGRLGATATAGIYNFSQQGLRDQTSAQGQVGMRYQF